MSYLAPYCKQVDPCYGVQSSRGEAECVFLHEDTQVKVTSPEEGPSKAGVWVMYVLTCVAGFYEACGVLFLLSCVSEQGVRGAVQDRQPAHVSCTEVM